MQFTMPGAGQNLVKTAVATSNSGSGRLREQFYMGPAQKKPSMIQAQYLDTNLQK